MTAERPFKLVAGHVALDFTNTLDYRYDPPRTRELLTRYEDLLRFCREAHLISSRQSQNLLRLAEPEKLAALEVARELREAMERLFTAALHDREASSTDLTNFNQQLAGAFVHRRLFQTGSGFGWQWLGLEGAAEGPLWPITMAAARLFASNRLRFVRECQAENCRWLFLDLSKNHSRRWCDMKLCGNRMKARRYYQSHSDRA
jgi:predicted RNA-binding Zn ribbon-like protein